MYASIVMLPDSDSVITGETTSEFSLGLLSGPSRVSATWFGSESVQRAHTSAGTFEGTASQNLSPSSVTSSENSVNQVASSPDSSTNLIPHATLSSSLFSSRPNSTHFPSTASDIANTPTDSTSHGGSTENAIISGLSVAFATLCILVVGGILWRCLRHERRRQDEGGEVFDHDEAVAVGCAHVEVNMNGSCTEEGQSSTNTIAPPSHAFVYREKSPNGGGCASGSEGHEARTHMCRIPLSPSPTSLVISRTAINGSMHPTYRDLVPAGEGDFAHDELVSPLVSDIASLPSCATEPSVTVLTISYHHHQDSGARFRPDAQEQFIPPTHIHVIDLPPAYTEN